jgi:hypothetical protein
LSGTAVDLDQRVHEHRRDRDRENHLWSEVITYNGPRSVLAWVSMTENVRW